MKFFVTKVKIKLKKLCDKIFKNFGGYIFRYKSGFYRYKSEATVIYNNFLNLGFGIFQLKKKSSKNI